MKQAIVALFCILPLSVPAQPQTSGWLATFNTIRLNAKTSLHSDFQFRSSDEFEHMQTLLLRAGVNVHLNKQWILTGGYAFILNRTDSGGAAGYLHEHRIWEQAIFNHSVQRLLLTHRLRFEQRFIPVPVIAGNDLKTDGYAFATRLRYFSRNIFPLKKQGSFKKGPFAALQDEIFFNITGQDKVNGKTFDQNRLLLAVGYRIAPSIDVETGYMNQYISRQNKAFTNNHIIQLATYIRL